LQFGQQLVLRELAHLQGIFDDRRVFAEAGRLQAAADGYDLTIQRRGKALVEAQLLLAEVLAAGQFGKVEEAEVHRLLDLVGVGASEQRSEEHTSELQSRENLVCRLLLEKKKKRIKNYYNSLIFNLKAFIISLLVYLFLFFFHMKVD